MKRSNEKALKIVEQQYKSFINLQDNWDFFRGLAEYTKTVQEMIQTKPLVDILENQRKLARKTYEAMNTDAMKEFENSAKQMTKIASSVLKQYEPLIKQTQEIAEKYQPVIRAVQEVQDRMKGNILSSNPLHAFDSDLFDIARHLRESGHIKEVKDFEDNKKRSHNIYGNYTFSKTYENLDEEEIRLKRKEQVEAWGAWEHLPMVERLVFEPEELKAEVKTQFEELPSLHWTWLNFIGVYAEMEKIRKGEKKDDDVVMFRVKDFKSYAQRVHNFITKELIKDDFEKTNLSFDDENRTLFFMNEEILISKKEESDPHKLMRTLFKDENKVWANDEVIEDWGYLYDEEVSINKVYQAGKKVNSIIAQETKIKDFIEVSTKSVAINKKYLNT